MTLTLSYDSRHWWSSNYSYFHVRTPKNKNMGRALRSLQRAPPKSPILIAEGILYIGDRQFCVPIRRICNSDCTCEGWTCQWCISSQAWYEVGCGNSITPKVPVVQVRAPQVSVPVKVGLALGAQLLSCV